MTEDVGKLKQLKEYALRTYNSHTEAPHFVTFKTDVGVFVRFLVDTGADISICKENFIGDKEIKQHNSCKITGIENNSIQTMGTSMLKLVLPEDIISHEYQIVDTKFPIATDGILGRDFFTKYLAKIDYETYTLVIMVNETEYVLPMRANIDRFVIPPRTEMIQAVNLQIEEDSVVCAKQIGSNVFIGNTIIPKHGTKHIRVLNASDEEVTISKLDLQIKRLSHYNIMYNRKEVTNDRRQDRWEKLRKLLSIDLVGINERQTIEEICKEFEDIFHLEGDHLTANNFYKQRLQTVDDTPVYTRNYRLPQSQQEEIKTQVNKLIEEDLVEPSVSPYNSALLLVPKKSDNDEKKWRLVVDYRQLNKKLVNDKFPLPQLDDVLDRIGRAKYFSTLDMTSSFHQIELQPASRPLTAFSTNNGHYQFKRLPFGLKISSNSFQRMLTIALTGLDSNAFIYVDDIIVFGCSLKHHNDNLRKVFQRLRSHNLKLNPNKCNFLKPEVVYLGHLITDKGVMTDPSKCKALETYPIPKNADDTRRFVAFCNYYRRFVRDFAQIAKPLNELLKKNQPFIWSENCQKSFEMLKSVVSNPPVLQYPDFEKEFILTTDASNYALGAVLSQGEINSDLPISYASRSLNKHEINKPVIEKELLAIHWGITHFRPYLYGRKFKVVTDHRPLVSLFTHSNPSSRLTRIRLDLMDYDFEIIYKQGKINTNADALSRIKIDSNDLKDMMTRNINVMTRKMTEDLRKNDKKTDKESTSIRKNEDYMERNSDRESDHIYMWTSISFSQIKGYPRLNFVIDKVNKSMPKVEIFRNRVVVSGNENAYSNLGSVLQKLTKVLRDNQIFIVTLAKDDTIFKLIREEKFNKMYNSMQNKDKHRQRPIEIILFSQPERILGRDRQKEIIKEYHETPYGGHAGVRRTIVRLKQRYIWKNMYKMIKDFISHCEFCKRNKVIRHTKAPIQITNTPTKPFQFIQLDTVGPLRISNGYRYILTAQCELTKYVDAFPIETKEASEIGRILVEKFILRYGCFDTVKTDRGTEFVNELFNRICTLMKIKHVTSTAYHHETLGSIERNHKVLNEYMRSFTEQYNWDEWIPYYTFAYNTTPHSSTGFSPFELVYGRLASMTTEPMSNDKFYNYEDYITELKIKLKHAHEMANRKLLENKIKQKAVKDKNINDIQIKIGDKVFLRKENARKSENQYMGPFKVINTQDVNITILKDNKPMTIHKNRIKLF